MRVDLTKNPKQKEFYKKALGALTGSNNFRHLFYGGAIRGGKSIISSAILLTAAKVFENSRWHIFRSDFPVLRATMIPTFEKIIAGQSGWGWNRDSSNFFIYNKKTDSKIFFKAENISHDPELNSLLGLETNGIYYEQIEELSEKLWNIGNSRNGSWYIPKMPIPITLATFNPSQTWIKQKVHDKHKEGTLPANWFYLTALPNDNPFVTKEQWENWNNLDERYKRQFIEGDWTNFDQGNNRWAFAFDYAKHTGKCEVDNKHELFLSFDFNRNPICCGAIQHIDGVIKVIEIIKLTNSDIYALCDRLKIKYGNNLIIVTGDASGRNSSALVKDNLNYYKVIKEKLGLSDTQLRVPNANPRLEDNQMLVNSVLSNYQVVIDKDNCKPLIFDLENVQMLPDGTIKKVDREDPAQQADSCDLFRYWMNVEMSWFLKM